MFFLSNSFIHSLSSQIKCMSRVTFNKFPLTFVFCLKFYFIVSMKVFSNSCLRRFSVDCYGWGEPCIGGTINYSNQRIQVKIEKKYNFLWPLKYQLGRIYQKWNLWTQQFHFHEDILHKYASRMHESVFTAELLRE